MGFYLRCAIAKVDDQTLADRICEASADLFPPFVQVRRFDAPFAGMIAAYDPVETHEQIVDNFAAHGYADEDTATEDAAEAIYGRLGELSLAFPTVSFVYVDVDCFGGTCMYNGFVVQDGARTHSEPASSNAHVRLFRQIGVDEPHWHFSPFTRGYMASGVSSDLSRIPTTFHVHARWDEPYRLAVIRASTLPAPWRITSTDESTTVIVHGETFVASLHRIDDHVEMRGKSFVDLMLTKTLAHELSDDDVALELRDADGTPL